MLGEISALITAFLWTFSSIAFTEASKRIGSQQLNINRLLIAFFFLCITVFVLGFGNSINNEQILFLSLSGFVGLIFGDGFLFKAFKDIGARISMLLMSLVPAITVLFGFIFLNERLDLLSLFGISLTMFGVMMVLFDKKDDISVFKKIKISGLFYGLMGAVGQAAGLLFAKSAFQIGEINGFTATFIRISSSLIIFFPLMLILRRYKNPINLFSKDIKALYFTIIGSVIGPFLGITFSLIAIKYAKVGIASTLMSTVPIIMLPVVRIVYKEKLSVKAIAGAIIAVIGVALLFLK